MLPLDVQRMMGLETAARLLGGKPALADALGISARAVRHKLTADRGISDADVADAAGALEAFAKIVNTHAEKLRCLVDPTVSPKE